MLETIEAIVVVIVLIGIGVAIGIVTSLGQYLKQATILLKKCNGMMDPLMEFYKKMLENENDL